MIDKLESVKKALERYADPDIQNQHNYKATMNVDDTIVAKEALAELNEVINIIRGKDNDR